MRDQDIPSSSRKSLTYRGKLCLNCGTPLDISDRFCHNCGQRNSTKRLTVFDYFNEFLMSVITYDSRIYYTVTHLFLKPGTISRNYIAGKRGRYANPFRFFLSVSIIFFLLSGFLDYFKKEQSTEEALTTSEVIDKPIKESAWNMEKDSAIVEKPLALNEVNDYEYISSQDLDTLSFLNKNAQKAGLFFQFYNATSIKDPSRAMDSLKYEKSNYNLWLYKKNKIVDQIKEDPQAFGNYIKAKVPFFLFFFTPVLTLFFLLIYFKWYPFKVIKRYIWQSRQKTVYFLVHRTRFGPFFCYLLCVFFCLFRVRRNFNYFEHLVFNFHTLIFVFLGFLLCLLPDFLMDFNLFSGLFFALCPFYFYKAMRNFYKESRILTLSKLIIINFVFLILGGITAAFFFTAWAAIY